MDELDALIANLGQGGDYDTLKLPEVTGEALVANSAYSKAAAKVRSTNRYRTVI